MIEIIDAGLHTTVQDRGRPGWASIGVPHSGAVDPALAARCNRMVGNPVGAAVIETVGGLRIRTLRPITVATDIESMARIMRAGETLSVAPGGRQWHYVAIRGGIAVEPVLESRSTDVLSGIGPAWPTAGDRLPVGDEPDTPVFGEVAPIREPHHVVRVLPGPRADWFPDDALDLLTQADWTITEASRVGIRLAGPSIGRSRAGELPSEGLVRGAIQLPPDGQPVVMSADHPTTGGYPVIAVIQPDDTAAVAQRLAGTSIRFVR